MGTAGLAPLPELISEGLVLAALLVSVELLEPLMDQIQGVVDQLGRLFGSHREPSRQTSVMRSQTDSAAWGCSAKHPSSGRSADRIEASLSSSGAGRWGSRLAARARGHARGWSWRAWGAEPGQRSPHPDAGTADHTAAKPARSREEHACHRPGGWLGKGGPTPRAGSERPRCAEPFGQPESPSRCVATPSDTRSPPTCWKVAPNIRTIQELLGRSDVVSTMIYTHVLNLGPCGVRSPADLL